MASGYYHKGNPIRRDMVRPAAAYYAWYEIPKCDTNRQNDHGGRGVYGGKPDGPAHMGMAWLAMWASVSAHNPLRLNV